MIEISRLEKTFKSTKVLKDVSLTIPDGEVVALIGPSGCGKTTTLKMINRLIRPSSGNIYIDGKSIYEMDLIKLRRSMGYVIQQTGLFPHMTVEENIEIIPRAEKQPSDIIKKKVLELMDMIGMGPEYLTRYPGELSGGQQQRIGVARAFANDPGIILMDEPFSALDPISRHQLQDELLQLQEQMHKTIVFVTHDMDEAVKLADRICIMNAGYVVQYDIPEEILKNPAGDFVESFVGKNRIWQSPELIRAEDVMIEDPVSCSASLTLAKGLEKMRQNKVDSLMVTDREGRLLGIIRAQTIRAAQNAAVKPANIGEIMQTTFFSCDPQQTIIEVLNIMKDHNLSSLPVVAETQRLKGLITKGGLVLALGQPILESDSEVS